MKRFIRPGIVFQLFDLIGLIDFFGEISGPDLMHFHLQHKNSLSHHAREVSTHKVITVEASTSIKAVAELMLENKVHHVVVSHDDIIEGIVSSFDIVGEYVLN